MIPKTPFDDIFDFNHDGKLDGLERASRDCFIVNEILRDDDEADSDSGGCDDDAEYDDD